MTGRLDQLKKDGGDNHWNYITAESVEFVGTRRKKEGGTSSSDAGAPGRALAMGGLRHRVERREPHRDRLVAIGARLALPSFREKADREAMVTSPLG